MTFFRQQATISHPVSVSGFGFWSGANVRVEFRPAPVNSGIAFVRRDLPGKPKVEALLRNRIPGPRRTTLSQGGVQIEMVEHLMAALAGLQIDNCEIHLDGAEIPGLDGSSAPFVAALLQTQRVPQATLRAVLTIEAPIRLESGESWIEARPTNVPVTRVNYYLDYPNAPAIGSQQFSLEISPSSFTRELAPARTFLLDSEAAQLQQQGLGQRVSFSDVLVFNEQGPIRNELRYTDECVRHKMLDIVGDFALSGRDWIGEISASRSGHELNAQMIALIEQQNHNLRQLHSA
jgi:UDP-3-O-[3-hydroxymyristoyl] N-acetylglucosamine deacetylase